MSDRDIRSLQRKFLAEPGDNDARQRLMIAERRAGMLPPKVEVMAFKSALENAAVSNNLNGRRGEFPTMSRRLLRLTAEPRSREDLRWAWFRVTVVQPGSPPLALVVRHDRGEKMTFALGRAQTGYANVLAPQLVWTNLGPNWFPGAHEHPVVLRDAIHGHEYRTSWGDADMDAETGLCRLCGESPTDPRVLRERPDFERKLTEFANGRGDPHAAPATSRLIMTSTAVVRTFLGMPVSAP